MHNCSVVVTYEAEAYTLIGRYDFIDILLEFNQ